jgi:hypothetical protein
VTKTELLLIASKSAAAQLHIPDDVSLLTVGQTDVSPSELVLYIGVLMDKRMNLEEHVNNICKVARIHLYRIGRMIHAFVSSRLDYVRMCFARRTTTNTVE